VGRKVESVDMNSRFHDKRLDAGPNRSLAALAEFIIQSKIYFLIMAQGPF
jgi:hypothetical protein